MANLSIDRSEVLTLLDEFYRGAIQWNEMLFKICELPPAGGMSAEDFLNAMQRRCTAEKVRTEIHFQPGDRGTQATFKAWVKECEQWDKEHPEKKGTTYIQDLVKRFPYARLDVKGIPCCCRYDLYGNFPDRHECGPGLCAECWNEEVPEKGGTNG